MPYYSERQRGPKPRTEEAITPELWKGITLVIEKFYNQNYFAKSFPDLCPDNSRPVGTDYGQMRKAVEAEILGLHWPLPGDPPEGFIPLDTVEFSFNYIAKPLEESLHGFFGHYHLHFDIDAGHAEFVEAINEVFARKGSVYQLEANGQVIRLAAVVL